ncbi:MAG: GNAT family N-acetyltransferase [Acidobacteriota bacterium]
MSIRPIRAAELPELLELCAEHAAYERSSFEVGGQIERWRRDLASERLRVWVAAGAERLEGFAAVSLEYSTWRAESYLHLDCLYVRESARGRGWGSRLLAAAREHAESAGCREIQWQTPPWNEKAVEFYSARGASAQPKLRFSLAIEPAALAPED